MPQPDYKIYRMFPNGTSVWMENAYDLQAARNRAMELCLQSAGQVAVYDFRNPARAVFETKR